MADIYAEHMREHDLHGRLKAAGCTIDNHESDLYVMATDTARAILEDWRAGFPAGNWTTFRSQLDGALWFDVPFMFTPWWEARCK